MRTEWLYGKDYRYKVCAKIVRRSLDKEYWVNRRNERPSCIKDILYKAKVRSIKCRPSKDKQAMECKSSGFAPAKMWIEGELR